LVLCFVCSITYVYQSFTLFIRPSVSLFVFSISWKYRLSSFIDETFDLLGHICELNLYLPTFVCSFVSLSVRLFVCSFVRSFVRSCTLNIINILGFGIKARTPPQNYMHYTHAIIVVEKEIGIGCLNYWGVFYCCSDDRGNVGRQCITFNSYSRFVLYNKRLSKHKPKKILLWNNWLCESSIVC